MQNLTIFLSEKNIRFGKVLRFVLPTYLTSLFNTLYTIVDGIFVSQYVVKNKARRSGFHHSTSLIFTISSHITALNCIKVWFYTSW